MAILTPIQLEGKLSVQSSLNGIVSVGQKLSASLTIPVGSNSPIYDGEYEVTPTEETQVLNTRDYLLTNNITINPIPSNYGRITWNGQYITVS